MAFILMMGLTKFEIYVCSGVAVINFVLTEGCLRSLQRSGSFYSFRLWNDKVDNLLFQLHNLATHIYLSLSLLFCGIAFSFSFLPQTNKIFYSSGGVSVDICFAGITAG